jgi:hypothetical protein
METPPTSARGGSSPYALKLGGTTPRAHSRVAPAASDDGPAWEELERAAAAAASAPGSARRRAASQRSGSGGGTRLTPRGSVIVTPPASSQSADRPVDQPSGELRDPQPASCSAPNEASMAQGVGDVTAAESSPAAGGVVDPAVSACAADPAACAPSGPAVHPAASLTRLPITWEGSLDAPSAAVDGQQSIGGAAPFIGTRRPSVRVADTVSDPTAMQRTRDRLFMMHHGGGGSGETATLGGQLPFNSTTSAASASTTWRQPLATQRLGAKQGGGVSRSAASSRWWGLAADVGRLLLVVTWAVIGASIVAAGIYSTHTDSQLRL